jgi:hypothetical protein
MDLLRNQRLILLQRLIGQGEFLLERVYFLREELGVFMAGRRRGSGFFFVFFVVGPVVRVEDEL